MLAIAMERACKVGDRDEDKACLVYNPARSPFCENALAIKHSPTQVDELLRVPLLIRAEKMLTSWYERERTWLNIRRTQLLLSAVARPVFLLCTCTCSKRRIGPHEADCRSSA